MDEITTRLNKMHRKEARNAVIEAMISSFSRQEDPCVGSFWYDPDEDELFGVYSVSVDDTKYYKSPQFKEEVRTGTKLHSAIWKREFHRGKDERFKGDYTQVPRGRVFEFKDKGFIVFTGDWIEDYPQVREMIIEEFQLPRDRVTFEKDIHWDLGHGWSDEF